VFPVLNHKVNVTIVFLAGAFANLYTLYFIDVLNDCMLYTDYLKNDIDHTNVNKLNILLHVSISSILLPIVQPKIMLILLRNPSSF
jgi:hypothetical protein